MSISDHSVSDGEDYTMLELPPPARPSGGTSFDLVGGGGGFADPARPLLVYAMVMGYETVQGNTLYTLFALETGTDTGATYTVHRRYSEFATLYVALPFYY
jgi:hypothetical protein